jgi:CBS domain-containing protein
MQVKDMMVQPNVIERDVSLMEVARLMSSKGIGSLIFVSRSKAKGIITESDLVKNFGKHKKISKVMSKNIISVAPKETVEEALRLMKDNNLKRLPVVDEKKSLVGIISMTDIAANAGKLEGEFFFN